MKSLYVCEICEKQYEDAQGAIACEDQGQEKPDFQPGEFVTVSLPYGWYDGDPAWIMRSCPNDKCKDGQAYTFYHVVTAITYMNHGYHTAHKACYHLATKAMVSQSTGGWNFPDTHLRMTKVDNPPDLDVSDLIGKTFEHLL